MIDVASLPATAQALLLVGAVLAESIILYVGYGAITAAVGADVRRALRGE